MNRLKRLVFISILSSFPAHGGSLQAQSHNVYGYVKYKGSEEGIPYAYCINLNNRGITYTNHEGFFSLKSNGPTTLIFEIGRAHV